MAIELKQNLKLAQKLVMTPQLRQAIRLLQLGRLELADALRAEMEQNPMLEEAVPTLEEGANPEALSNTEEMPESETEITSRVEGESPEAIGEVNWDDYDNTFDSDFSFAREAPADDAPDRFDFISVAPGLDAWLLWQLAHLQLDERDRAITGYIVGNLDRHGYLTVTIPEICKECACSEDEAEGGLRLVQSLDPAGIAARDLRECLLLQLDREERENRLAVRMVADHMDLLEAHDWPQLARILGATQDRVREAAAHIRRLNPYPGNEYDNDRINYVSPDVYVFRVGEEPDEDGNIRGVFVIRMNDEGLPHLRLSGEYLEMLKNRQALNAQSRSFLLENKRNAEWILKSVEERQRTLYKVVESLLRLQRDFFEKGPLFMKPLIMREVASDIGVHESTISRVTMNKYIHTPQGIYTLKFFFNTALTNTEGDTVGSEAIRTRIRQLVDAENPVKPLSDNRIAELLAGEGMEVARRTVAKYREQMKILPVKHRRLVGARERRA